MRGSVNQCENVKQTNESDEDSRCMSRCECRISLHLMHRRNVKNKTHEDPMESNTNYRNEVNVLSPTKWIKLKRIRRKVSVTVCTSFSL